MIPRHIRAYFSQGRRDLRKAYRLHREEALSALKVLEPHHGKLSRATIQQCDDYAKEILGSKIYAPWLYFYSSFAGTFKEGWIPENYFGRVVCPKIKNNYRAIAQMKGLNKPLFQSDCFPDLLSRVSRLFIDPNSSVIPRDQVKDLLFQSSDKVIYKVEASGRGQGIHWFHKDTFDPSMIDPLPDGIFQAPIKQHPFFDEFMSDSVVTIRLTTVIEDSGKSTVRCGKLRIGRKNESHITSSSQIHCVIYPQTGKIGELAHLPDWTPIDRHPDTGRLFADTTIPDYDRYVETVTSLHQKLPHNRCLGWDLIMDHQNRIQVMEYNSYHNGMKYPEGVYGPCFADLGWENLWKKG